MSAVYKDGMNKIKEYTIASGQNRSILIKSVNELIEKGFEPFGNVYLEVGNGLCQPMVRRETDSMKKLGQ